MTAPTATSAPSATSADGVLADLRAELDRIDHRLLDTLRARIACCVDIGRHKARHGVPMMAPHRIDTVQRRAAAYAAEHDIDGDFLRRLYDLVIGETCRVEDLVIGAAEHTAAEHTAAEHTAAEHTAAEPDPT